MADSSLPRLSDSDDDLAGFLTSLRARYHIASNSSSQQAPSEPSHRVTTTITADGRMLTSGGSTALTGTSATTNVADTRQDLSTLLHAPSMTPKQLPPADLEQNASAQFTPTSSNRPTDSIATPTRPETWLDVLGSLSASRQLPMPNRPTGSQLPRMRTPSQPGGASPRGATVGGATANSEMASTELSSFASAANSHSTPNTPPTAQQQADAGAHNEGRTLGAEDSAVMQPLQLLPALTAASSGLTQEDSVEDVGAANYASNFHSYEAPTAVSVPAIQQVTATIAVSANHPDASVERPEEPPTAASSSIRSINNAQAHIAVMSTNELTTSSRSLSLARMSGSTSIGITASTITQSAHTLDQNMPLAERVDQTTNKLLQMLQARSTPITAGASPAAKLSMPTELARSIDVTALSTTESAHELDQHQTLRNKVDQTTNKLLQMLQARSAPTTAGASPAAKMSRPTELARSLDEEMEEAQIIVASPEYPAAQQQDVAAPGMPAQEAGASATASQEGPVSSPADGVQDHGATGEAGDLAAEQHTRAAARRQLTELLSTSCDTDADHEGVHTLPSAQHAEASNLSQLQSDLASASTDTGDATHSSALGAAAGQQSTSQPSNSGGQPEVSAATGDMGDPIHEEDAPAEAHRPGSPAASQASQSSAEWPPYSASPASSAPHTPVHANSTALMFHTPGDDSSASPDSPYQHWDNVQDAGIHPDPAAALRTSLITHGNPLFAGSPVQPATAVSTADDSHQVSGGVKGDGVTMQPTEASAPHASAVHPMTTREAHSSESLAALQADPGTNPAAEATTAAAASSLPAETAGDGALPSDSSPTAEDSASPDWQQVNQLLSANGFQTLQMQTASSKSMAADTRNASQDDNSTSPVQPDTQALHSVFLQVLREYSRRDALVTQLLADRVEQSQKEARDSSELAALTRERDQALRAAEKAKAELVAFTSKETAALEAKHRDAQAKLTSEINHLKFALKESESALLLARQAGPAVEGQVEMLEQQLREAHMATDKYKADCDKLTSELSRQKLYVRDLERATASARQSCRRADDDAYQLRNDLGFLRAQADDEVAALMSELNKSRQRVRELESEVLNLRNQRQDDDLVSDLTRQLTAQQQSHDEEARYMRSELHKLRSQVLDLQQSSAKTEAVAKADRSAASFASKQLALQESQHEAELAKTNADVARLRDVIIDLEQNSIINEKQLQQQAAKLAGASAAAKADAMLAAQLQQELTHLQSVSKQQAQRMNADITVLANQVALLEQQLAVSNEQLRRLRAAGLSDKAGGAGLGLAGGSFSVASMTAAGGGARKLPKNNPDVYSSKLVNDASRTSNHPSLDRDGLPKVASEEDADSEQGVADSSLQDVKKQGSISESLADADNSTSGNNVIDADLSAAVSRAMRAEALVKEADATLVALKYKCGQLEHVLRMREGECDKLRDKLADKVRVQERRLVRDKEVYARLRQAYAAAKRDGNARSAAGAVSAAARELRPIEIVALYENQKEAQDKELAAARAEVRTLSTQLRDAQNLLISKDKAVAAAARRQGAHLSEDAEALLSKEQRRAAELTRELCSVRADAAEALRATARRLSAAETEVAQLKSDVAALMQELNNRPTVQENRQLKREIDLLEQKIARLRHQASTSIGAGATAEHGEAELALMSLSAGASRGTRAAMERDKQVSRLKLQCVEEYPRDVLVDLVQDACVALELSDATVLVPTVRKVLTVVSAIPKLEVFVAQVCEICFRHGLAFVPHNMQQDLTPAAVPDVLRSWLMLLQQHEKLQHLVQQIINTLAQRSAEVAHSCPQDPSVHNDGAGHLLVAAVQHLVVVEAEAHAAQDMIAAAKQALHNDPDSLLHKLIQHVQHLFECPSLEGLLPTINKVYVRYNELGSFFRALASLLALPHDAGPGAAVAKISKIIKQAGRDLTRERLIQEELSDLAATKSNGIDQSPGRHVPFDQAQSPGYAAGDASGVEALLAELGAASYQQAVAKHQQLADRLKRFDVLLPRYQRLISQLYEVLRVSTLDEIISAVEGLVSAAK